METTTETETIVSVDVTIPSPNWKALVTFASKDALRPAMQSVLMRVHSRGAIEFVSTNGHQLIREVIEVAYSGALTGDYLITPPAFAQLKKMKGNVTIKVSIETVLNRWAEEEAGLVATFKDSRGTVAHCKIDTEEKYPNYVACIPEGPFSIHVYANTETMRDTYVQLHRLSALDRTERIEFTPGGTFTYIQNGLNFDKYSADYMKKAYDADPVRQKINTAGAFILSPENDKSVGFNMRYLAEVDLFTEGDFVLSMEAPNRAAISFQSREHTTDAGAIYAFTTFLLMPVMLGQ